MINCLLGSYLTNTCPYVATWKLIQNVYLTIVQGVGIYKFLVIRADIKSIFWDVGILRDSFEF